MFGLYRTDLLSTKLLSLFLIANDSLFSCSRSIYSPYPPPFSPSNPSLHSLLHLTTPPLLHYPFCVIHSLSFLNSHHFSPAPQSHPPSLSSYQRWNCRISFHPTFFQLPLTFSFLTLVSFALVLHLCSVHSFLFFFFSLDVNIFFFSQSYFSSTTLPRVSPSFIIFRLS